MCRGGPCVPGSPLHIVQPHPHGGLGCSDTAKRGDDVGGVGGGGKGGELPAVGALRGRRGPCERVCSLRAVAGGRPGRVDVPVGTAGWRKGWIG